MDVLPAMTNWREATSPTLPCASVPRTANVWVPADRPENVAGLVQFANGPPSRLHWYVAWASSDVNVATAVVPWTETPVTEVFGACVSTAKFTVTLLSVGVADASVVVRIARYCR